MANINLMEKIVNFLFKILPLETKYKLLFNMGKHLISDEANLNSTMNLYERILGASDELKTYALAQMHHQSMLTFPRFNIRQIQRSIDIAKAKFPDCQLYLMSDDDRLSIKDLIKINSVNEIKEDLTTKQAFVLAFNSDQKLLQALKSVNKRINSFYITPSSYKPTARYFHRNDLAYKVLLEESKIQDKKFDLCDFENLIQAIEITRNVEGVYLEIGVYQGRSAHLVLNYMKQANLNRKCYFLDTYEGFNYEAAIKSADTRWSNTHADTSLVKVQNFLKEFTDFHLIKANIITNDLPTSIEKIALCNIDVDMYEAVLNALKKVAPLVVKGGLIILEDQGHTPALAGAYLATNEFLESPLSTDFVPIQMSSGQMFLIKIS